MENYQYLNIFLEGIEKHSSFLPEHLKREQVKAEKEYVGYYEFVKRSIDLLGVLNEHYRTHIFHQGIHKAAMEDGAGHLTPKEVYDYIHLRTSEKFLIPQDYFTKKEISTLMKNGEILVDAFIFAFKIKGEKNGFGIPKISEISLSNSSYGEKLIKEDSHHPTFNPNLWNRQCFELFKYLYDHYFKGKTIRQLTNIWFYLKEYDPEIYTLIATKDLYIDFIQEHYGHTIKNFDKTSIKYIDKDRPTMDGHRMDFEEINNESLKSFE